MELAQKHNDELFAEDVHEAYLAIAKEVGYNVLGKPVCDTEFEQFRQDVGVVEQRRWEQLEFDSPVDENCPCWFVANAASPDKTVAEKLVCRSLLPLKMELQQSRVSSTEKLRLEFERRLEDNASAVASLTKNAYWWSHVDGPDVELLREPTPVILAEAQQSATALTRMVDDHKPTDGTDVLVGEIARAVSALKVVSFDSIYADRFSLTPYELYQDMVRNVEMHLARRDAEAERRRARLGPAGTENEDEADEEPAGVAEEDSDGAGGDPGNNYFRLLRGDKHLVDIDRQFKFPGGRDKDIKKPAGWQRAVRMATEIHINDMRPQTFVLKAIYYSHHHNPFIFGPHVPNHAPRKPQLCPSSGALLEIHYDECHIANWHAKFDQAKRRVPERKGELKVFQSVIMGHRRKPNQRVQLPASVKGVLRKPSDELSWAKLEGVRKAVVA